MLGMKVVIILLAENVKINFANSVKINGVFCIIAVKRVLTKLIKVKNKILTTKTSKLKRQNLSGVYAKMDALSCEILFIFL
jgi:hypothetical protein